MKNLLLLLLLFLSIYSCSTTVPVQFDNAVKASKTGESCQFGILSFLPFAGQTSGIETAKVDAKISKISSLHYMVD